MTYFAINSSGHSHKFYSSIALEIPIFPRKISWSMEILPLKWINETFYSRMDLLAWGKEERAEGLSSYYVFILQYFFLFIISDIRLNNILKILQNKIP